MKKIFLTLIASAFVFVGANAQTESNTQTEPKFKFGTQAGLGISFPSGKGRSGSHGSITSDTKTKPGFSYQIGLAVNYTLPTKKRRWSLDSGLQYYYTSWRVVSNYTNTGNPLPGSDIDFPDITDKYKYSCAYIFLPVHVRYAPGRFSFFAGIDLGYQFPLKVDVSTSFGEAGTATIVNNKGRVGIVGKYGVGFDLGKGMQLNWENVFPFRATQIALTFYYTSKDRKKK